MPKLKPDVIKVRLVRNGNLRNARLTGRVKSEEDLRSEARRDRDRVAYSTAWRRLAGVTQVITPFDDTALLHNRLTHSEKVAQVARTIAERLMGDESNWELIEHLGGIDVDVVEAAALAHDLGHPPFGHAGEQALDDIARRSDGLDLSEGFDGNAQTLRTVLLTETRHADYDGMDLTSATLVAIAKYPWMRAHMRQSEHQQDLKNDKDYRRQWCKFGIYRPENNAFEQVRQFLIAGGIGEGYPASVQSIEASIMDIADDISYAVHDLEDFVLAGVLDVRGVCAILDGSGSSSDFLVPLKGRLALDYAGYYKADYFDKACRAIAADLSLLLSSNSESDLYRMGQVRNSASRMISKYVESVSINDSLFWLNGPFVALRRQEWHEIQILKEITKKFVITRPDLALLQHGQQELLCRLVTYLREWQDGDDFKRLPGRLRFETEIARRLAGGDGYRKTDATARPYAARGNQRRCIIDYICSLTDGQCYTLFHKLVGLRPATSMELFA